MVDAGHDVVGVHLALSSAPGTLRTGSRGCCSKEDAGDARRVGRQARNPVLRLGFRRSLQRGRDRRLRVVLRAWSRLPIRACGATRRSSSRRWRRGRWRWASTRWPPATTRRLSRAAAATGSRTPTKDQSYVLAVLTADQIAARAVSGGRHAPKPPIRAEAAARGLTVADKPDSHDICFIPSGDTRAFLGCAHRRCAAARSSTGREPCWHSTTACTASRSASARASASPDPGRMGARGTSPRSTPRPPR